MPMSRMTRSGRSFERSFNERFAIADTPSQLKVLFDHVPDAGQDDGVIIRNQNSRASHRAIPYRGTSTRTRVPVPGADVIENFPPANRTRSFIPTIPRPSPSWRDEAANPTP